MFDLLANAASQPAIDVATDTGLSVYGVHIPAWALAIVVTLAGVVVVLKFVRKLVIPELGGMLADILRQLKDLREDANTAKSKAETAEAVANVQGQRVTNLAKATISMAQASPAPENAQELRQSALEHAQAALSPPETATPPAPSTPENNP